MSRTGMMLVLAAVFGATPGVPLAAQGNAEPLVVEAPASSPRIARLVVRGDTVFFFQSFGQDSTAWLFDRHRRVFTRVEHADLPFSTRPSYDVSDVTDYGNSYLLGDSISLVSVYVSGNLPSNVLRVRSDTVALRGPRIAAERRWRVAHGLSAMPAAPDTEDVEHPPPPMAWHWGPVQVSTFAVDSQAIWLGLKRDPGMYGEFTLGGLLRVDRRTRAVSVVADSLLLHASVDGLLPWRSGYVALLRRDQFVDSASLAFFDPVTRRARPIALPSDLSPWDIALAGDTAWIAAGNAIAVLDLASGRVERRGFRLAVHGDSVVYDPADRTRPPPLPLAASVALAQVLELPDIGAFVQAAEGVVRVDAFKVYEEGERFPQTVDRDSSAAPDSVILESGTDDSPVGLVLGGLESPALRPFLYEALRLARTRETEFIANLLIDARDTAAIPALRAALDRIDSRDTLDHYPHGGAGAPIAMALARLGDSTGVRWIRTALGVAVAGDVRRELPRGKRTAALEYAAYFAATRLRDPVVMDSLVARVRDTTDARLAVSRLLDYETVRAWRAAVAVVASRPSDGAQWLLFSRIGYDTSGLGDDPIVRDSTRAIARRAFEVRANVLGDVAGVALARYRDVNDLPSIIGAIDRDSVSYVGAVLTLVRITGDGVDAMPRRRGTAATRAEAARWWRAWYDAHRGTFQPATRQAGSFAWERMFDKIYKR